LQLADRHRLLVTIEENAIAGGAGSAVSELLAEHGINVRCLHLGLPDICQEQAEHGEQLAACGLDATGIEASVRAEMTELGGALPASEAGVCCNNSGAGPRIGP
jgi:1-deoxy-D-xylulose-5-phosphate synthase